MKVFIFSLHMILCDSVTSGVSGVVEVERVVVSSRGSASQLRKRNHFGLFKDCRESVCRGWLGLGSLECCVPRVERIASHRVFMSVFFLISVSVCCHVFLTFRTPWWGELNVKRCSGAGCLAFTCICCL